MSNRAVEGLARRTCRLIGPAVAVVANLAACATVQPTALPPAVAATSPPASGAASDSRAATGVIPPLLLSLPSGDEAGLWRIDPNGDPAGPSWRTRIEAPPGRWRPTAPSSGGLIALTSIGEAPVRIVLARMKGDRLVAVSQVALPTGDMWTDGYAGCTSPGGLVAVADAGLTLSVADGTSPLAPVPGQRDDLGRCAWLDPETLVWDQEDRHLRTWAPGDRAPTDTGLSGLAPSAGGGRFAWFEEGPSGTLHVAAIASSRDGLRLGSEVGRLVFGPAMGRPGGFDLSPDGRWLLGLGMTAADALSAFLVADGGLVEARSIPLPIIPFAPGDAVTWMPATR